SFYSFNDQYFMTLIQRLYQEGFFNKNIKMKEITECLLFGRSPKVIHCPELSQRLLDQDDQQTYEKVVKRAREKVRAFQEVLDRKGSDRDWMVIDIPKKDITFCRSKKRIVETRQHQNLMLERDPAKMLDETGEVKL